MARRITDTNIWKNKRWFRKLSPEYKIVWCYIKDQCNHAGVWEINCLDLMDDIGLDTFDLADFIKCCNRSFDKMSGQPIEKERLKIIEDEHLWLTGFVQFQYQSGDQTVNVYGNFPKGAIQKLADYGLLAEALAKGYLRVSQPSLNPYLNSTNPYLSQKGKGERKEEDKEIIKKWYNSEELKKLKLARAIGRLETEPTPAGEDGATVDTIPLMPTQEHTGTVKRMTNKEVVEFKQRLLGPEEDLYREELMKVKKMESGEILEGWLNYFTIKIVSKEQTNKNYPEFKEHFTNWILPWDTSKPLPNNLNGRHKEPRNAVINPKDIEAKYAKPIKN